MTRYIQFRTEKGTEITAPIDRIELYRPEELRFDSCRVVVLGDSTGVYDVSRGEYYSVLALLDGDNAGVCRTSGAVEGGRK